MTMVTPTRNAIFAQLESWLYNLLEGRTTELSAPAALRDKPAGWLQALEQVVQRWQAAERKLQTLEATLRQEQPLHILAVLREISQIASTTFERSELCEAVVQHLVKELGLIFAAVHLLGPDRMYLEAWAVCGSQDPGTMAAACEAIVAGVARTGEAVHAYPAPTGAGELLCLPIHDGALSVGALTLLGTEPCQLSGLSDSMLHTLAQFVSLILQSATALVRCQTVEREQMLRCTASVTSRAWEKENVSPPAALEGMGVLIASGDENRLAQLARIVEASGLQWDRLLPDPTLDSLRVQYAEFAPDAVLIDLSSPGEDGWPLLLRLVQGGLGNRVPVLFCGFDDHTGQSWLGYPTSLADRGLTSQALREALHLDSAPSAGSLLVVENNPWFSQRYCEWLRPVSRAVRSATDGAQGIDALLHDPPDGIVCDVLMPDRCALQLLAELTRRPSGQEIPCLLVVPSKLSQEEQTLLVCDAQWTAASHGSSLDLWTRMFHQHLLRMRPPVPVQR